MSVPLRIGINGLGRIGRLALCAGFRLPGLEFVHANELHGDAATCAHVSVDYATDPRSAIVDALSTRVVGDTQVKVLAWYDNEWAYANRLVELARIVGSRPAAASP